MGIVYNNSIITDGLVMCLDAGNRRSYPQAGSSWVDITKTPNTATLQNNPIFSNDRFSFDGVDDRVLINCAASTVRCYNSTTQFAVKLPVYSGGQRCILSYRSGGGGNLYIGKSGGQIFCYYDQLNNPVYLTGSISANSTIFCNVTCDATNNTITTYLNGVSLGGVTRTGWITAYNSLLYLGYDAGGTNEYMLGDFFHFAHYNRVLKPNEIQNNFNAMRGRFGL